MELSGRLTAFALPELMRWASNDLRSGSLVVRRGRREKLHEKANRKQLLFLR